jgi:ribosome-binding factor A
MPKFRRTDRINEQFKQEISLIVRDEVRDPRVGLATITAVQTSPELDHAKVYVTSLGDAEEREEIIVGLRSAAPFIRKQLAGRLSMRRIPELHFEEDRVLSEAMRIEQLLREALPNGVGASDEAADDEVDADDGDDVEVDGGEAGSDPADGGEAESAEGGTKA